MRFIQPIQVKNRYLSLMISMLLLAIIYPILSLGSAGLIVWTGIFWAVLIFLMRIQSFSNPQARVIWRVMTALALGSCSVIIWCYTIRQSGHGFLFVMLNVLTLMFLIAASLCLSRCLFQLQNVSTEQLTGVAALYLLLGLVWTYIYHVLFALGKGNLGLAATISPAERHAEFLYFSFVTLSTIGYGDVVPETLWMRVASATEGMIGQVFLAILVARSVGFYLATTLNNNYKK